MTRFFLFLLFLLSLPNAGAAERECKSGETYRIHSVKKQGADGKEVLESSDATCSCSENGCRSRVYIHVENADGSSDTDYLCHCSDDSDASLVHRSVAFASEFKNRILKFLEPSPPRCEVPDPPKKLTDYPLCARGDREPCHGCCAKDGSASGDSLCFGFSNGHGGCVGSIDDWQVVKECTYCPASLVK